MTDLGTDLPTNLRARIVFEARLWLGTPYRHQASIRGIGCDCLGLARGIWVALYGREPEAMPAYSSDWAEASGRETLLEAARLHMIVKSVAAIEPGDMVAFRWRPHLPAKHLGLIMPGDGLLHAYETAGWVTEGPLAPAWRARIAAAFAFPDLPGGAG